MSMSHDSRSIEDALNDYIESLLAENKLPVRLAIEPTIYGLLLVDIGAKPNEQSIFYSGVEIVPEQNGWWPGNAS